MHGVLYTKETTNHLTKFSITKCSVNYQLSIRINDRHGSMRIDNGYYNKDYGLLAK